MRRRSKGTFVLVAVAAALAIAVAANLVADRFAEGELDWIPSVITAVVVGAFVALIVFRPRGTPSPPVARAPQKRTEFVIEGHEVHEGPERPGPDD